MKYLILCSCSILLFLSCKKEVPTPNPPPTETLYFPPVGGTAWETTTPESLNWNTGKLQDLYDYLQQQDTRAFIVLKNGKIVLEKYFGQNIQGNGPFNQNSLWYWASAGKTLTSFMVGKAQVEGFLNINNKTSTYLGNGWTSAPLAKENAITVRHQLTMTSGLDDGTGEADNTNASALIYKADAGTRWAYHNAPYTLLQKVVSNATGKTFSNYFDTKLKNPIGMDGQWIANGFDNVYWSTARSMARFGILIQAGARWNGTEILGDPAYLTASINTSQNLNLSYGYLWWLNGKASFMVPQSQTVFSGYATPTAPADLFAAMGRDGQLLNIVPSKGLVVVRMGYTVNSGLVSIALQNGLWEKLSPVIQ
jgi:CubicO group peptidase (beta-lactamase class C family)